MNERPWRAAVIYQRSAFLVGFYETLEAAKEAATADALMLSEQPIKQLEVDATDGRRYRQYWLGRSPRGEWNAQDHQEGK